MQKMPTSLQDLYILKPRIFQDERGSFIKQFNNATFADLGLESHFTESYYSTSQKGVIRGMHFQIPPFEHAKLVYVSNGKILDVVVDLRKASQTFGEYFSVILDSSECLCLYIPQGFAHGFLSLEDKSKVHYMQTSPYNPQCDSRILFDSFGFDWQEQANKNSIPHFILSKRDKEFVSFADFIKKDVF